MALFPYSLEFLGAPGSHSEIRSAANGIPVEIGAKADPAEYEPVLEWKSRGQAQSRVDQSKRRSALRGVGRVQLCCHDEPAQGIAGMAEMRNARGRLGNAMAGRLLRRAACPGKAPSRRIAGAAGQ
jgi:hypothetical protein